MNITNKNTEEQIKLNVMKIIELGQGCLQNFNQDLQERMQSACFEDKIAQFYNLKLEVNTFLNDMEQNVSVPTQEISMENPSSKYRFTMYELCDRFVVSKYREEIKNIEQSEASIEQQCINLWNLAHKMANEARMMLTIADLRMAELI